MARCLTSRGRRLAVAPLPVLLALAVVGGAAFLWSLPPGPQQQGLPIPQAAADAADAPDAPDAASMSASAAPPPRHVTRSLSELGVSGASRGLSDYTLLFNSVPRTGSELLTLLLKWLQASNGFRLLPLPQLRGARGGRLSALAQEEMVAHVTSSLRREALPVAFHGHVYFTNFSTFDRQSPTHVNLVRDPVERALTRIFNPRGAEKSQQETLEKRILEGGDLLGGAEKGAEAVLQQVSIPYFCGHDSRCSIPNSKWALQRAKANVEKYYPVVGILEELNATMEVLERRLPLFFTGVKDLYFRQLLEPHINWSKSKTVELKTEIRRKVEKRLALEYELYIWAKQRLMQQYYEDSQKAPIPGEAGQDRIAHSIHKRAQLVTVTENEYR